MPAFAINKKAKGDYKILDTYDAGIKLTGAEVKSIKSGGLKLAGAFVTLQRGGLQLTNAHVSKYKPAGPQPSYNPTRSRPLLVKKAELKKIIGTMNQKGLTMVPLRAYSARNLIKLEFAIARGKRQFEKREVLKKRSEQKTMRAALKRRL